MALCGVCEPAPRSRLPRRFACTQPYRVFLGTPSSLAALAYPISLASFTACTLYSWSYCLFPAILSTLLILLIISQILENEVSTFFIPHHFDFCHRTEPYALLAAPAERAGKSPTGVMSRGACSSIQFYDPLSALGASHCVGIYRQRTVENVLKAQLVNFHRLTKS